MAALVFDTCCGCIKLRTGCLIIGYLQLIGEVAATIMLILGLAAVGIVVNEGEKNHDQDAEVIKAGGTLMMVVFGILLLFVILAMAFTITLLVGVHKEKRGHVKSYLIYAVIFMVIALILFFVGLAGSGNNAQNIVSNIISLLLNIYFLLVIRSHYIKMGENKGPAVYTTA